MLCKVQILSCHKAQYLGSTSLILFSCKQRVLTLKGQNSWKNEVVLIVCFCHACAFWNNGVALPQVRRCTELSHDNTQRRDGTDTSALTSAYFLCVVLGLFLLRSCSMNSPDFLLLQVVSLFFLTCILPCCSIHSPHCSPCNIRMSLGPYHSLYNSFSFV